MTRQPSLRTLLLTGLLLLELAVVGGITTVVWARARSDAHAALQQDVALRAKTLAGIVSIDPDGLEFELSHKLMPEYVTPGSGAYFAIHDATGRRAIRSLNLGDGDLAASGPWAEGACTFAVQTSPDGIPVAAVTYSFVVPVEHDGETFEGRVWTAPPVADRMWRVVVAADTRPRDERLAGLAWSLGLTAFGGLVVTAIGGLLVARAVLNPVRRMTAEAAALTPADPSRRLRRETVARELVSLSETLNSALDRLADALDRQKRFAADASHELRTPLAILLGNAELLLRRDRTGEEYRRGLVRQERIARRMTRITENLLALARADDGRTELQSERVALGRVAADVCDELLPMAAEGGVALHCDAGNDVFAVGDATHLEELVQNLVANGVNFTPAGGTVRVRVSREQQDAVLEVTDTGKGIAQEQQTHLFERFHRVAGGKDPREGAGLGLAIVAWIVRAHGGRIDLRSEVGRGTTFTVRLPLGYGADLFAPSGSARVAAGGEG